MKYNIQINQLLLAKTTLNIIDCALLDYLYFFCNSSNIKIEKQRITNKEGKKWTWVDYGKIIEDMPLLGIKTTQSLTPHIKNLEKNGFIETIIWQGKRKYIRLLQKTEDIYVGSEAELVETISRTRVHDTILSDVSVVSPTIVDNVSNAGNVSKKHVSKKLSYIHSDKLCTAKRVEDGCGHCANCSLTVCSPHQLYVLALEEEVNYEDVKHAHDNLITWIEGGRMKDLTVFRTLRNWIRRDVSRGGIKQLNYMELEMMKLKFDTELRAKLEAIHERLEKGEI